MTVRYLAGGRGRKKEKVGGGSSRNKDEEGRGRRKENVEVVRCTHLEWFYRLYCDCSTPFTYNTQYTQFATACTPYIMSPAHYTFRTWTCHPSSLLHA
jgi:hypothetical protein